MIRTKGAYSIPLVGGSEYKTLGNYLTLEMDLANLKPSYTLQIQKDGDKALKASITSDYRYEPCCEKK
jgi:hypothetical protein